MAAPRKHRHAPLWPVALVVLAVGFVLFLALTFTGAFGIHIESGYPSPTPTPSGTLPHTPLPPRLAEPVIDSSAIVVSGNAVTIHWDPVEGADKYLLRYSGSEPVPSNTGLGFGTPVAVLALRYGETRDPRYTFDGLVPGTEYTFYVIAHDDDSRYRRSGEAEVKVKVPSLPTPPTPIVDTDATVVSGNAVTFYWGRIEGVGKYRVAYVGYEVGPDGQLNPPKSGLVLGHEVTIFASHTTEGLMPSLVYTFRIAAFGDGLRYAGLSSPAEVTVQTPPDESSHGQGGAKPGE